jgi:hypothetical protein
VFDPEPPALTKDIGPLDPQGCPPPPPPGAIKVLLNVLLSTPLKLEMAYEEDIGENIVGFPL